MGFANEEFPFTSEYDSDLRAVLKYVRKLNTYVKTWDDTISEIKEAIKELNKVPQLEQSVDRLNTDVKKLKSDTKYILSTLAEIDDWKELTDTKLIILASRIDRLRQYVDDMDAILREDYNNKFYLYSVKMNQMKIQLMGYINGIIERMEYMIEHLSVDVRDPMEDIRITFDRNNMSIYNRLSCGCITQEEFAELGLTEAQFRAIGFTQMQFALDSANILHTNFIFGPVSGIRKSHEQAIAEVLAWICDTMTEAEFEAMSLTEEEFEALNLTHEQYLRYNTARGDVVVDPNGTGLTENQYQHLTVG